MRSVPSARGVRPVSGSCHRTRRPCRSDSMRPWLAVRAIVCRADFSSTPRAPRAVTRVPVHADPPRGWTNSPSAVSSSARALPAVERSFVRWASTFVVTGSRLLGCRGQGGIPRGRVGPLRTDGAIRRTGRDRPTEVDLTEIFYETLSIRILTVEQIAVILGATDDGGRLPRAFPADLNDEIAPWSTDARHPHPSPGHHDDPGPHRLR